MKQEANVIVREARGSDAEVVGALSFFRFKSSRQCPGRPPGSHRR